MLEQSYNTIHIKFKHKNIFKIRNERFIYLLRGENKTYIDRIENYNFDRQLLFSF